MTKIKLLNISDTKKQKTGHLFLLFSHLEWLIANTVLLIQMPQNQYSVLKDLEIINKYLKIIFGLGFEKKLELLEESKYNCSKLKDISRYRNMIAHGIIFEEQGIQILSVPHKKQLTNFYEKDLDKYIELIQNEGGKLIDYIKSKGYKLLE